MTVQHRAGEPESLAVSHHWNANQSGMIQRGGWQVEKKVSKGKEAMSADGEVEFVFRAVSGRMSLVLGGHAWRQWSADVRLLFNNYVCKTARPPPEIIQTFEDLPCSAIVVRGRLKSPSWTVWKAETTESAEDGSTQSMERYSGEHFGQVYTAISAYKLRQKSENSAANSLCTGGGLRDLMKEKITAGWTFFIAPFIDRSLSCEERCALTRMSVQSSDIVGKLPDDCKDDLWVEEKLITLWSDI